MATTEPETAAPSHRAVRVRCEACLDVVVTSHPWDHVTCSCGRVAVSGRPWRPSIQWLARPGGGWSILEEPDAPTEPLPPDDVAAGAQRPIGY